MKTAIIYSDELKEYDFGPGHPFRSDRFASFLKLYGQKLAEDKNFQLVKNSEPASDEQGMITMRKLAENMVWLAKKLHS